MTTVIDTIAIRHEVMDRMKLLQLAPAALEEYRKGNVLKSAENRLHYLTPNEQGMIEDIEEDYNVFVYHIIQYKNTYTLLYVSCGDWEAERNDTRFFHPSGCVVAGNKEIFNQVGVRSTYGVLRRIY